MNFQRNMIDSQYLLAHTLQYWESLLWILWAMKFGLNVARFLVGWLAFHENSQIEHTEDELPATYAHFPPGVIAKHPITPWTLLGDIHNFNEEEIDQILPQVCSLLVNREELRGYDEGPIYDGMERLIIDKCDTCLPLGMKMVNYLQCLTSNPSSHLFQIFGTSSAGYTSSAENDSRDSRLRELTRKLELSCMFGPESVLSLSEKAKHRSNFFKNQQAFMESLGHLSIELLSYPESERTQRLRQTLKQFNSILMSKMLTGLNNINPADSLPDMHEQEHLTDNDMHGQLLAQLATQLRRWYWINRYIPKQHDQYPSKDFLDVPGLHFPLFSCISNWKSNFGSSQPSLQEDSMGCGNVLRLLRFLEEDSDILPSKKSAPFVVIAEVIGQSYHYGSSLLYCLDDIGSSTNNGLIASLPSPATKVLTDRRLIPNIKDYKFVESILSSVEPETELASESTLLQAGQQENSAAISSNFDASVFSSKVSVENVDISRVSGSFSGNSGKSISHAQQSENANRADEHQYHQSEEQLQHQQHQHQHQPSSTSNNNRRGIRMFSHRLHQQSSLQSPQVDNRLLTHYASQSLPFRSRDDSIDISLQNNRPKPKFRPLHSKISSKFAYYKATSPFSHLPQWDIKGFIVKNGKDFIKEAIAMQVVAFAREVFHKECVDISLRPYQIYCLQDNSCGFVEYIDNAHSIDAIKKSWIDYDPQLKTLPQQQQQLQYKPLPHVSLKDYFVFKFGPTTGLAYSSAIDCFVRSLAGYSLITYLLQLRDRHNANILIDEHGAMIHIDYGYILGASPGMNMNFENVPFKLTREYVELMGGIDSAAFKKFENLFVNGFLALQRNVDGICALLKAVYPYDNSMDIESVRTRLLFFGSPSEILELVRDSYDSWRTRQYDWFQSTTNGIAA